MSDEDGSQVSDEFAKTASALLKEFSGELRALQQASMDLLDELTKAGITPARREMLRARISNVREDFHNSNPTYDRLVAKASQWLSHGKKPKPSLEMELEIRLCEFEDRLKFTHSFFAQSEI